MLIKTFDHSPKNICDCMIIESLLGNPFFFTLLLSLFFFSIKKKKTSSSFFD